MSALQTEEQWRLAEALALEKLHGADAPRFISERIGVLALADDRAGVARMRAIAVTFDKVLSARHGRAPLGRC